MSVTPVEASWWRACVSLFPNAKTARPHHRFVSWSTLCESLTTFRDVNATPYLCKEFGCYGRREPLDPGPCPKCGGDTSAKIGTACWSPARYPEGVNRAKSRVVDVSCLVLDYDDGTTLRAAHEQWADWEHVMHTSWSHSKEHHKCRVVVPLLKPVPADGWARVHHWAMDRSTADEVCKDPSRIYFLPSHPVDAPEWGGVWHGPQGFLDLDPETLPKTPSEIARESYRPPPKLRLGAGMSPSAVHRAVVEQLKTDEGMRRRVASMLSATISEGVNPRADKIRCPGCGRPSVHYMLTPGQWNGARCSHRNSCGWRGWVDQLLTSPEELT